MEVGRAEWPYAILAQAPPNLLTAVGGVKLHECTAVDPAEGRRSRG